METQTPTSERINGRLLLASVMEAKDLSTDVHHVKASQILNEAKVDWTVSKRPTFLANGTRAGHALVRDDIGTVLASVGSRYTVNQNTVGLSAFDRMVDAGLLEGYSNAGTFGGGKLAWIQAQIKTFAVGGDEMRAYLTLTISHGSVMRDRWNPTATRIVCKNTFVMARDAANGGLTMGHTTSGNLKFEAAVERIHAAMGMLERFRHAGENMASQQFSKANMVEFSEHLFPAEGKPSTRLEGIRQNVVDLYDNGTGIYDIRGTRWAAFNAVTEYADHARTTRRTGGNSVEDSRLASAWFGSGADLKQRAYDYLTS